MMEEEQKGLLRIQNRNDNRVNNHQQHEQILNESKSVAKAFIISSAIGHFTHSLCEAVWLLYLREILNTYYYGQYNVHSTIITLTTLTNVSLIFGIIICSYFGDKYGFDILSIITAILIVISTAMQCVYISITLWIIGLLIDCAVSDDIEIFSLAFIGKYLPFKTAVTYTGYYYTYTEITYLLGFIVSGIITTYLGTYRFVYFIALFIDFSRLVYILYAIRNKEKHLLTKQLQFIKYYKEIIISNNESVFEKEVFPLCLDKISYLTDDEVDAQNTSNIFWIELILNTIQFSIITSQYIIVPQFYPLYMHDRFNTNTVISLSQIGLIGVCTAVIGYCFEYFEDISKRKKYLYLISCNAILFLLFYLGFPAITKKYADLYWVLMFIVGSLSAVCYCLIEILILELQPKADTGKISGFKSGQRYMFSIFTSFFIAYFWDSKNDYVSYWNVQAVSTVMALCINIVLISIKKT